ncbi:MAG: TenA family protein [Cyanobacteria bacterium P01_A01_bin.84]
MSISEELWLANQDLVQACLEHPFVKGIANGNLNQHKFMYYVGQDAFFLESFARAYSIAAAKAPDWEGFITFHALADGVLEELRLHQNYAAQWKVDLGRVEVGTATRRYTDFLIATAWSGNIGLIAAAMSPCMSLYGFLGKKLASKEIPEHKYTDWIRTYSSDDFQPLVEHLARLVDTYADSHSSLHSTYRYAMVCERDFFQAAWEFES